MTSSCAAHAFSFFLPQPFALHWITLGAADVLGVSLSPSWGSPVLWDGGGETALFFFKGTFKKLPFYSYFGETPWGSSHIEAGSAQSQAQLSTAQPHPKSRCHGSCPHICSACPPQKKKRVSFEPQLGWLKNQRMDGSNRPRPRNAGLRWSCWRSSPIPLHPGRDDTQTKMIIIWMILAGKICFKSGVKEVSGAASGIFMWCWNYTSAQSKTQPKSEFHNYAANPSFSIIATPSKRFRLATSHTSSNKT